VASVLKILFIWLPFCFELNGLVEEWIIFDLFSHLWAFLFRNPFPSIASSKFKATNNPAHAIAYWMEMNSVILLGQFCVRQGIMLVPSAIKLCEQLSNILLKNDNFFVFFFQASACDN